MNKTTIIFLLLLIGFYLYRHYNSNKNKIAIQIMLKQGIKPLLLDVREAGEFKYGSATGAVNIPLGQLSSKLEKLKGESNVIVFCKAGIRATQAQKILKSAGIANVINGGSWQNVEKLIAEK